MSGPKDVPLEDIVIRMLPGERYTTPDSEGAFYFYNLREGNYELVLDKMTLPEFAVMDQSERIPCPSKPAGSRSLSTSGSRSGYLKSLSATCSTKNDPLLMDLTLIFGNLFWGVVLLLSLLFLRLANLVTVSKLSSTAWCTTRIASKCGATRCAKNAALSHELALAGVSVSTGWGKGLPPLSPQPFSATRRVPPLRSGQLRTGFS